MMRIFALASVAILAAACSPEMGAPAATPTADAASASAPHANPAPPIPPADAGRVGTMNIKCGSDDFRIVFEDARAVLVNADGSNTDLLKLEPQPMSLPTPTER